MNEEIDEYDIYHQDFTTVSDWEVFIARLEEILSDWHLSKSYVLHRSTDYTKKWLIKSEEIKFNGLSFTLSYHSLEVNSDAKSTENVKQKNDLDNSLFTRLSNGIWDANKHFMSYSDEGPFPVSSWFGLKQYVMLLPHNALVEESQIRTTMSSMNVAFANVDCGVPFFLKVREHWQQCFLGIFENKYYRTNYDTIHLQRIPTHCLHLNGITHLFKGKVSSPVPLEPIEISAKFSYELKDFDSFSWKRVERDEFIINDTDDLGKYTELPFGPDQNPIRSVLLNVMWPRFLENAVVDSSTYSDFDPIMAPMWMVSIKMRDEFDCQLADCINRLLDLLTRNQLLMDILGLSRSMGLVNPLHKITEAPITISKLVKAAIGTAKTTDFKGPIYDGMLMPILYYLFPDAEADERYQYLENLEVEYKQADNVEPKLCGYVKTSPEGGLVWRLSLAATRLHEIGGLPYLAHLWYEFTEELQYRWQHSILVPGVADGEPNARTCLLHQKLQMLNWCILRAKSAKSEPTNSSDDEFFDASDGENAAELTSHDKPTGRLRLLEDATLKNGQPLYIPVTQDPAPKTEDQLEEDAELMVQLGDDPRASQLRAKMMSASLLSDMEAFKAANPGAELCDFVRWYSPHDWKPDGGGALGERMLLPGNPWTEAWGVARPVPATRQRRLFDETREAEQTLHYLRSRSVAAVAELLLPAVLRAGGMRAARDGASASGVTGSVCDQRRLFEIAARELYDAEREASLATLRKKILGESAEDVSLDSSGRSRILSAIGGTLSAPVRREFCLRTRDQYAPQAMRVALSTDMFIVGAFTERIVLL